MIFESNDFQTWQKSHEIAVPNDNLQDSPKSIEIVNDIIVVRSYNHVTTFFDNGNSWSEYPVESASTSMAGSSSTIPKIPASHFKGYLYLLGRLMDVSVIWVQPVIRRKVVML